MKNLIIICFCTLTLSAGINPYINNINGKIIDIGSSTINTTTGTPLIWDQYSADFEMIDDVIETTERELSLKTTCVIDKMGTTVCPLLTETCDYNEEIEDGYSIEHNVFVQIPKLCPEGYIKKEDKCFIDENKNGIADGYPMVSSERVVWENVVLKGNDKIIIEEERILEGFTVIEIRHTSHNACDDDSNILQAKVDGTNTVIEFCPNIKDTGYLVSYTNETRNQETKTITYIDEHVGGTGEHDTSTLVEKIKYPSYIPIEVDKMEVIDNFIYYYTDAKCPEGILINENNECTIDYTYYEYKCSDNENNLGNRWKPKNEGYDCGGYCPDGVGIDCKCNDEEPPANNCYRVSFGCPLDSNQECAATQSELECPDDYLIVNGRCERTIPYCADNKYNAEKDICEESVSYIKECANDGDIYNAAKNICESTQEICENGEFDNILKVCKTNVQISCESLGYIYNSSENICENPNINPCATEGYVLKGNICVSEYTICESGLIYNKSSGNCEKSICINNINSLVRLRCERDLSSLCTGTLLEDGSCIPTQIVR